MRSETSVLRDFTVDRRVWLLSGVAIGIGVGATVLAVLLLRCIALFTNLFYYHRLSFLWGSRRRAARWVIGWFVVPVFGGILVGLMARFGSDKIRGHGIPEAIEAILLHRAKVDPKIAPLKPISAAICHRFRRTLWRGRSDHYDRRSGWIADRAVDGFDRCRAHDAAGRWRGGGYVRDL